MTTENETPKEAKPEPVQTMVSEHVRRLVAAHNLAGKATGYTYGNEKSPGNIISGSGGMPNPVLSQFIEKAEKAFVLDNQKAIIQIAEDMLKTELDEIRGCLG